MRVELKYQFAYDLANRVGPTLHSLAPGTAMRAQVEGLRGGDFQRIAFDCIGRSNGKKADLCNVFILIVQDRYGARHDAADQARKEHELRKKSQWRCQPLYDRGVRLQFLDEQVSWESKHSDQISYAKEWIEPTWEMLRLIYDLRPFSLHSAVHLMAANSGPFPLTSHIFTLDFTDPRVPFPEDGMEFASRFSNAAPAP